MTSIIGMEHEQIFSAVDVSFKPLEDTVLLPRSSSSSLHRRSFERLESENSEQKITPAVYSLEEITARRRGKRVEDEKLPKKVRSFYKKQDKLISTFERVHRLHSNKDSDNEDEDEEDEENNGKKKKKKDPELTRKRVSHYTKLSLFINVCLFIMKIVAACISESLSVISSVVDSGVDLASSALLLWATRAIKRRDPFMYPQGRTRLEPLSIVIISVIMCSASVQIMSESAQTTVSDIKALQKYGRNSSEHLHPINMTKYKLPIIIMCSTIVLKLILFILCSREHSVTLNALAEDHRNDVLSNTIALFGATVGHYARLPESKLFIPQWFVLADTIGAIVISIYIFITWVRQAAQQIKRLTGHTAKPEFLQQITWIAFHHSSEILKIDTVRAFHFGTHFLVEVDIVLPEQMSLKDAHDIGEGLQKKIERIPEVERAFVHLDYEYYHKASDEHKVV